MLDSLILAIKSSGNFSDDDIELLKNSMEQLTIPKAGYFLKAGQISRQIGYITKGLVMYFKMNEGNEIPCDFAMETEWVTYLRSFTTATASDMYIKALENTE